MVPPQHGHANPRPRRTFHPEHRLPRLAGIPALCDNRRPPGSTVLSWLLFPLAVAAPATEPLPGDALRHAVFVRSEPCDDEALCEVVAVGSGARWTCTGVVVAPGWVLTARHCLPARQVAVGHDLQGAVRVGQVVATVPHPDRYTDAALLQLDVPLDVPPAALWTAPTPPERPVRAVGFGSPDAVRAGRFKQAVDLRVDAAWGCDAAASRVLGCGAGRELVAATLDGKDTCDGDSGGPLFAPTPGAERPWAVVGITSRPVRNSRARCGDGGIFVRADRLADWVRTHTTEDR